VRRDGLLHDLVVPELVAVPIGAFADPAFPQPRVSVYESRRHPWVHVPEDVERDAY
jgi:hypothetical protein